MDRKDASPLVSVVMITYGHEAYIEEAIEGVIAQETDFPIELIIADDLSPDRTPEIVQSIMKKDPRAGVFKYTRHSENKGMMSNFIWALSQANGEYIALCEGDDYWIDNRKLAKQMLFLKQNIGFSMVFHKAKILRNDKLSEMTYPKKLNITNLSPGKFNRIRVTTNSVMFRKKFLTHIVNTLDQFHGHKHPDFIMFQALLMKGNAGYIDETMCVYRLHEGGTSFNQYSEKYLRERILELKKESDFFTALDKKTGMEVKKKLIDRLALYIRMYCKNDIPKNYEDVEPLIKNNFHLRLKQLDFFINDKVKFKLLKLLKRSN